MLDLNHGSGARAAPISVGELVNRHIDDAMKRRNAAQPQRDYLGASRLGEPCARRLAYEYRHEAGAPFEGLILRVFAAGHAFEALTIEWLRAAGFDLRDRGRDGQQFAFSTAGGRIRGHVDGVIVSGPWIGAPYPLLWEHKAINERSWNDLVKRGLAASKEVYHGQVQLYMGYLDLTACLFSALNKNTQELYHELVMYDPAEAQRLSDRAVDIIRGGEAGELPPRIAAKPDFYLCRMCGFAEPCWRAP
jgi:hypothetical protein